MEGIIQLLEGRYLIPGHFSGFGNRIFVQHNNNTLHYNNISDHQTEKNTAADNRDVFRSQTKSPVLWTACLWSETV